MSKPTGKPAHRPRIDLDFTDQGQDEYGREYNKQRGEFMRLCGIFCTKTEIAAVFNCCPNTLSKRIEEAFEGKTFSEVHEIYREQGKVSLRRQQIKHAETNAYMSVWLGKQYLGQKEKIEQQTETTHKVQLSEADRLKFIEALREDIAKARLEKFGNETKLLEEKK